MAILLDKRWTLAALIAVVGAAAVVTLAVRSGTSTAVPRSAASPVAIDEERRAPDFVRDVPEPLTARSYRELATAATEQGEEVRLFTGALKETGSSLGAAGTSCFGLRTAQVVGMACGVDLSGTRPLQVNETTYRGQKMVAGLVSSEVEEVYLTGPSGQAIRIPIRGQTFFFSGRRLGVIEAYAHGEVVGRYELAS